MQPKIIAFSGAHGTGKTTSVNTFADMIRVAMPLDCKVGVITETARGCPLPVYSKDCSTPSQAAQAWMFSAQMLAEIEAFAAFDVVISDRTLVDTIAYTRHFGYYVLANAMEGLAMLAIPRYRTVVFKSIVNNDYLVDDGFRAMDIVARRRIERIMAETYRRMGVTLLDSTQSVGIPYDLIKSTPEEELQMTVGANDYSPLPNSVLENTAGVERMVKGLSRGFA